ncbi:polysaccharide deacetylase family protein [Pseudalkalibacillus caeni]|uniref:Polysaccharide deacetylase family protein n=1 Tax=Exobacillus caeni TaxID=2574798 RepID=A0A5R9F358_9BACL|nr:polysaccharide deacetylase family protein [Pseudalkalibacillus caeni]TLS35343.1 polysaccharide deacetylase family protein [Pseudalkalibacillus caeni]
MVDCDRVVYDSKDNDVLISSESSDKDNKKAVVLTFDDGPSRVLPQILDILAKKEVKAAFFWQSRLLYPGRPWKRVLDEGHLIGNHSCKHPNLTRYSYEEQYKELYYSKQRIEEITGNNVTYFRPPFGQYNADTIKAAKELNMVPVMWRIASIDWELKDNPKEIVSNVVNNLEDGAIILLHELKQTVSVLPELIDQIREKGYSFNLL